jgi:hypothetical protein
MDVDFTAIESRLQPQRSPEAAQEWGLLDAPKQVTRRAKGKKVRTKVSMYDESETPNNPHEGKIEVGPNFKAVSNGKFLAKKP